MAKKNDHLADFATEHTGGMLSGFLADEEHLDWRAMLRLGTWGAASVGAIIVALLANQSSLRLRHDEVAAADLSRQAQQIQSVARESQNETRRLASAIDTLNSDRDRMYSRLTTLEQGLDSVTGAIAKQNSASSAPPATPSPAASTTPSAPATSASAGPAASAPQPAADGAASAPAAEPAATEPAPLIGPVATTTLTGKQAAEAKRREANAKMAAAAPTPIPAPPAAAPAPSNAPATTASMPPMGTAKSMMGPPDPAAPKLIEPEPAKETIKEPVKTAAATPQPAMQPTSPAAAAPTTQASPEIAAATPANEKAAADKPAVDKPATEKTATSQTAPQALPQLAVNRTEFGVDVGGANSVGGLRALWRGLLKSRSNAPLAALQPIIVIKEGNNGLGMQLRLVAGPLTDAAAAARICATMVENERPCSTAVYDGQHLALKTDDMPASTGSISPKMERASETPEAEKPAAEKPTATRGGSGRQTWRRHSYQRRTTVEEPPAEKPKTTSSAASTISSFFHRSN